MLLALTALLAMEMWAQPVEPVACPASNYGHFQDEGADGLIPYTLVDTSGFPAIFPAAALDPFRCAWYSEHLVALGETALGHPADGTLLRFTWLRTFHRPMVFSILLPATPAGDVVLTWKEADGAGGYEPGQLADEYSIPLGAAQLTRIQSLLDAAAICDAAPDERLGTDGAQWIFETASSDAYCIHDGYSPWADPFRELREALMDLAGLPISDRY